MKRIDFDWQQAHEDDVVVVNFPSRKLAIFANQSGHIGLIAEEDGDQLITEIDVDEAKRMVELLNEAIAIAEPTFREMIAEFITLEVIDKASK